MSRLRVILVAVLTVISILSLPSGIRVAYETTLDVGAGVSAFLLTDANWLWVLLAIAGSYYMRRYWHLRETPIRVFRTEITLTFSEKCSRCHTIRKQWVLPNRPDIEAYYGATRPGKGTVPRKHIETLLRNRGKVISGSKESDQLLLGDERSGWQIFQQIDGGEKSLPYTFWNEILPDWIWAQLASTYETLGDRFFVLREASTVEFNEYDGPSPYYEITAVKYSYRNLRIHLQGSHHCRVNKPIAYLIKDNSVDVLEPHMNDNAYEYVIRKFEKSERVLIAWPNGCFTSASE